MSGLGFGDALRVRPGSILMVGGRPREVIQTSRAGRGWPYFQLRGEAQTCLDTGEVERGTSADWVSWMTCGRLEAE
jgi:hypothetical protein